MTPRFRSLYGDPAGRPRRGGRRRAAAAGGMAPADRPYVVVNMVATLDGRAAIDGRAGPIGNEADRQLFHHLRTRGDAVMAGAGTVRVERYGRLTRDELRPLRAAAGVRPEPLAVVVSRSLRLPPDLPLAAGAGPRRRDHHRVGRRAAADAGARDVPARAARRRPAPPAHTSTAIRAIVCEGGPHLNRSLFPARAGRRALPLDVAAARRRRAAADDPRGAGDRPAAAPSSSCGCWSRSSACSRATAWRAARPPRRDRCARRPPCSRRPTGRSRRTRSAARACRAAGRPRMRSPGAQAVT